MFDSQNYWCAVTRSLNGGCFQAYIPIDSICCIRFHSSKFSDLNNLGWVVPLLTTNLLTCCLIFFQFFFGILRFKNFKTKVLKIL